MDRQAASDKRNLMRNTFRRNSVTEHGHEVIDRRHMLTIFGRMGQPINERKLNEYMDKVDSDHSGYLDYDAYTKVCDKFVKEAAALAKFKGDEFAFKNIINLSDFESP